MTRVLLYAPQDFHNLCLLVRTLEALGHRDCFVFDPHRIVRDRYGKVRTREMRAVSAGAFDKLQWHRVEEPREFIRQHEGRVVATSADVHATSLLAHRAEAHDLLLFGSESTGLPPEVVALAAVSLTIPLSGQTRSLNLAVALGVVLFEYQRQVGSLPPARQFPAAGSEGR